MAIVDRVDRRSHLVVAGRGEIGLVDLDVLAPCFGEALEILVQQLAEIGHHPRRVVVIFVISHGGQKMRSRHGDLDGLAGERRDGLEFLDEAQIDGIGYRSPADRGWMKHVRIVAA